MGIVSVSSAIKKIQMPTVIVARTTLDDTGTEDKTRPPTAGSQVKGHFQINDGANQQLLLS